LVLPNDFYAKIVDMRVNLGSVKQKPTFSETYFHFNRVGISEKGWPIKGFRWFGNIGGTWCKFLER
jgi:hypothetical protein